MRWSMWTIRQSWLKYQAAYIVMKWSDHSNGWNRIVWKDWATLRNKNDCGQMESLEKNYLNFSIDSVTFIIPSSTFQRYSPIYSFIYRKFKANQTIKWSNQTNFSQILQLFIPILHLISVLCLRYMYIFTASHNAIE